MVRRGVLGWILIAVLLGGAGLIAASAEAQPEGGGNGLQEGSPLAPTPQIPGPEAPVPIGTLWQRFQFTGVGVPAIGCPGCSPTSDSQGAPAPPWTFTAPPQGGILTVTDAFDSGDVFEVFDFGFPIGATTVVGTGHNCGSDPAGCVFDPLMSHGSFFLAPGNHSIIIVPVFSPAGGGGAFFRVDTAAQVFAISTRGVVQTGDNVLIAGVIITGNSPALVLVRAIGPTLSGPPYNVPGALSDPTLTLYDVTSTQIAFNDDWQDTPSCAGGFVCGTGTDIQNIGGQPPNGLESAILIVLNPGAYTAIVRGFGTSTGVALVEVYEIPLFTGVPLF